MTSSKYLEFWPLPPCPHSVLIYSIEIMQPPLLHLLFGNIPMQMDVGIHLGFFETSKNQWNVSPFKKLYLFLSLYSLFFLQVRMSQGGDVHMTSKLRGERVTSKEEEVREVAWILYNRSVPNADKGVYRAPLVGGPQGWWILFLLWLTTSASTCLQHSRNLGPDY